MDTLSFGDEKRLFHIIVTLDNVFFSIMRLNGFHFTFLNQFTLQTYQKLLWVIFLPRREWMRQVYFWCFISLQKAVFLWYNILNVPIIWSTFFFYQHYLLNDMLLIAQFINNNWSMRSSEVVQFNWRNSITIIVDKICQSNEIFHISAIDLPFVILRLCASFSQVSNDAFNTSANFLFVPGVKGGMPTGISREREGEKNESN